MSQSKPATISDFVWLALQAPESVAEEEVCGQEWDPDHLTRHGKCTC